MRGGIIIEIHACIDQGKEQIRLCNKIDICTNGTKEHAGLKKARKE